MLRISLTVLPLAVLVACSTMRSESGPSDVQLRARPSAVAPGDSLTLVLSNDSGDDLGYNLCTSTLERRAGQAWEPVRSERVCTMELRTLGPGEEADFTFALDAGTSPGEYRALANVERLSSGERVAIVSEAFRVE